jgi:hypothetical protein
MSKITKRIKRTNKPSEQMTNKQSNKKNDQASNSFVGSIHFFGSLDSSEIVAERRLDFNYW